MISGMIDEGEIPSMAVAVAKNGEIIWDEAFGFADKENMIEATPQTVYPLGSLSKSITGTGLMLLVERELISLDDPVANHTGAVKLRNYGSEPKIRHVVNMTAGIPHLWKNHYRDNRAPPPSASELVERYGFFSAPPGELFLYSNLAFSFPEVIVSNVTKKDFADFMRSEVFLPLGMRHTFVNVSPDQREFLAKKYDTENEPYKVDYDFYPKGGGGMYSSAHDLIKYALFHLKTPLSEQTPILREKTIDALHKEDDPAAPNFNRYSMGWGTVHDGKHFTLISDGRIGGANSALFLLPEKNIGVVCLTNHSGYSTMLVALKILDALVPGYESTMMEFIGFMEGTENPSVPFRTKPDLLGNWEGQIRTYEGDIPVGMTFTEDDTVLVKIGDQAQIPLMNVNFVDRPDTVVSGVKFYYRVLTGDADARISTGDAMESEHHVSLRLRYTGSSFVGIASATAADFQLPSDIHLSRAR
jgi:CubicO group peptidase (beta-lactamase class C family)